MPRRPSSQPELTDDTQRLFIMVVEPVAKNALALLDVLKNGPIPVRTSQDPQALLHDPRRHRWVGLVIGAGFDDDEAALDWGLQIQASSVRRPVILWLANAPSAETFRRASHAGVLLSAPPPTAHSVAPFLDLCDHRRTPDPRDATTWAVWELSRKFGLTDREQEVVQHLVQDNIACEVAEALGCSEKTVNNHIARLSKKVGISGTRSLVAAVQDMAQRALVDGLPLFEPTPAEALERSAILPAIKRAREGS